MSPGEASVIYRKALDSITRYLENVETPRPMIDAMVATGSAEMRWVDAEKDTSLGRPPSIAEWETASCGSFTAQENDAYLRIMGKMAAKMPLSQQ